MKHSKNVASSFLHINRVGHLVNNFFLDSPNGRSYLFVFLPKQIMFLGGFCRFHIVAKSVFHLL